jgi:hypothetical protein
MRLMDGPAKGKRTDTHKRRRSTKLFGNCIVLNKSKKYSRSKTRRTGKLDKENKYFPKCFQQLNRCNKENHKNLLEMDGL